MSDKVNAKLYKIEELRVKDKNDSYELINEIVLEYNTKSNNIFKEIDLKPLDTGNQKFRLYTFHTALKTPTWLDFLNTISDNQDDLKNLENKYSSFVLFVYNEENIFAITKGYYGHHLLAEYIDNFFGLEVLSRLVDKSSTEIRQIEERGIFGIEVGSQRFFRENYNLALDDDFGKIYKGLLASVDEEDFKKLGIVKKRATTTMLSISGSTSLEVSTNFNFRELLSRIEKIVELLKNDGVEFNQFYRLSVIQLSKIRDDLSDAMLNMAYDKFINKESIDFYHPNINNYLRSSCSQFRNKDIVEEIEFSSSINYIDIINRLSDDIIDTSNKIQFIESLKSTFGSYQPQEDFAFVNEVSLDKWIAGEIEYNGKKYFRIDNAWYLYRATFDGYLNEYFKNHDSFTSLRPTLLKPWTKKYVSEAKYNESYLKDENFIIGDRALISYIEIADLIKIDGDKIYIYHVKKGLGQDMRVLSNQIVNAARFLTNIRDESDKKTLKKYYEHICSKHYKKKSIKIKTNGKSINLSEEEFLKLFTKKIVLVFAYASKSKKSIEDEIIATNSRIAKLSLIYTIRDLKRTDFEFLIERISL